jgi:hypothetical protein
MRWLNAMDVVGIMDALRQQGSALVMPEAIRGDFVDWRRRVPGAAGACGIRVSVRRVDGWVCVVDPDWESPPDHDDALVLVLEGISSGEHVTFDEALEVTRRSRLRAVT